MVELSKAAIEGLSGGEYELDICNCDRSIGARVSGEIARLHGNQGMAKAPLVFRFKGTAGQSFGVWNAGGLHLYLEGDANDYVGKGMTGGKLVITRPRAVRSRPRNRPSSATPACTAPPAASCSPPEPPASASPCATPVPMRWWKVPATTAANT